MWIIYKNHFRLAFINTFNYSFCLSFQIYVLYMDIIILILKTIENVIAQPITLIFDDINEIDQVFQTIMLVYNYIFVRSSNLIQLL